MADPTQTKAGYAAKAPNTPGSVVSDFIVMNSDATAAQAAGDAISPWEIDESTFNWVEVEPGMTRIHLVGYVNAATTAVNTDPIVKIIGLKGGPGLTAGSLGPAGFGVRIDSPDDVTAAGVTLDFGTIATDSMVVSLTGAADGGYITPLPTTTAYDLLGCRKVGVLVITAGAVAGTGAAMQILGTFLN